MCFGFRVEKEGCNSGLIVLKVQIQLKYITLYVNTKKALYYTNEVYWYNIYRKGKES